MLRNRMQIHEYTVSVNLVKNKRPGGDLLPEVDFELIKATGQLRPLAKNEMPQQWQRARGRNVAPQRYDRAVEEAVREYEQGELS